MYKQTSNLVKKLFRQARSDEAIAPDATVPLFPSHPPAPSNPLKLPTEDSLPALTTALQTACELPSECSAEETMPPIAKFIELRDLLKKSTQIGHPAFWAGSNYRFQLAEPTPPPKWNGVIDGTEAFAEDWIVNMHKNGENRSRRDAACYFACDVLVSGDGQVWLQKELVTTPELMPTYKYKFNLGLPAAGDALVQQVLQLPFRVLETPCVVMPGGQNIYGHFLIETLLYILLVRRMMRARELPYKILLPSTTAPWLARILRDQLGFTDSSVEVYEPDKERVLLRQAILPTTLLREGGFHPLARTLLSEFVQDLELDPSSETPPRIFLVRGDFANPNSGKRRCTNETNLVEYARSVHGFVPISMEHLPWIKQIEIMRRAEIVLGIFGSAMHGTLFSPSSTRVACLGFANAVQSEIAALQDHQICYLTRDFQMEGDFAISETLFAQFLAVVCN